MMMCIQIRIIYQLYKKYIGKMAQYPRGPAKQHLTFFDGGLEYNSSGPFNGANNVLKGE